MRARGPPGAGKIGLLLEQMGRRGEALGMLRKAREIVRPVAQRAPDHTLWNGYLQSFERAIARLERQAAE